ncbi:MAG TPA: DUF6279 family lipoprotein [Telluria sp.]|nr:DUF6279 family lipoprotein [Telluria sp.]
MKKFNTADHFTRRIRVLLLAALIVLAAACSSIRFTYNHGDTLLYWWLNAYLDLDSEQAGWVKRDIDNLFQWHRKTQLRDYTQLLANGQRQLAGNMTQADLMADYHDIKARTELLAFKALPELADLARSVRPEQITQMEKKFNSNNDEYRRKFLRGDNEKRQKLHYQKSMEQLELWFGPFSSEQQTLLRKASEARPLNDEVWLDERIRRQQRILSVLRKVQQDKLSKDATIALIHSLVKEIFDRFDAPDRKQFFDAYIDGTAQFILTAVKIATPAQKAHAQKRMQGWIDDFNTLATEPIK